MEDALYHVWSTIRDKIAYGCEASMPERLEGHLQGTGMIYALLNVFRCAQSFIFSPDSEDQPRTICMVFLLFSYPAHYAK